MTSGITKGSPAAEMASRDALPDDQGQPSIKTIIESMMGRSKADRQALIEALADGPDERQNKPNQAAIGNPDGPTNPSKIGGKAAKIAAKSSPITFSPTVLLHTEGNGASPSAGNGVRKSAASLILAEARMIQ